MKSWFEYFFTRFTYEKRPQINNYYPHFSVENITKIRSTINFGFFQGGWEMPSEDSGHAIDFGGHDGIPSVGGD